MITQKVNLRNVAIIAHVDHGKTTLVDEMLKQAGVFRDNQEVMERVMDSNDIERERGITILAKNTAVRRGEIKLNIVDTPGHADFGGEVERVLKMVNGVLLLVDAFEGPMPQTRFVLQKALDLGHPVVIVVNKVDRPDARPLEVANETLSLLIDLGADEKYLESPVIYTSGRHGTATLEHDMQGENLDVLFDAILHHVPCPEGDEQGPLQVLISTIDYSDYLGRIGVGRVERGTINKNQMAVKCSFGDEESQQPMRVAGLFTYEGLGRIEASAIGFGEIVALSGIDELHIGDTVCDPACVEPLPFVSISEPTVMVTFSVNNSPFAGKEGKYVTSRHLRTRLFKEMLTDVSLRVDETDTTEAFSVAGRGELHLTILMENMRRQGYEFQVSKPEVLYRMEDGVKMEPMERLMVDVPAPYAGAVIQKIGARRGVLLNMGSGDRVRLEFSVPSRGLFGYRSEFMTDTRGEGILSAVFDGYEQYKGDLDMRQNGSLVSFEAGSNIGTSTGYALNAVQERGEMYIVPGTQVYNGMVVGRSSRQGDIEVNVCRKKHLTAIHTESTEEALRLKPVRPMTLEDALETIAGDELVEVTPSSIRLRKRILSKDQRLKIVSAKKKENA